MLILETNNN